MATAVALRRAHRAEMRTLTGLASRDLSLIWADLDKADALAVRDALTVILPPLVTLYGSAAATLGADWYEEVRSTADVDGRFTAITAKLPDVGRTNALAGWAVGPLFAATPNPVTALTQVTGGLQRIIADADRHTIMQSAIADPAARGWERVGSGECDFCSMLIGRGAVYTEASADFESHDHCRCASEPVWS